MIPANRRIWIVAGITDMRRGLTSLGGLVQTSLEQSPLSGEVFVFRGRRGDLVKILFHDGKPPNAGGRGHVSTSGRACERNRLWREC